MGATAAAFHGGTITDSSTEAATEVDEHTQNPVVASKTWLKSGPSSPAWSPFGMIPAPEGKGMEQAVSWGVSWGQLYVLGSNGRQYVYKMPALPSSQVVRVRYILSLPHFHGNVAARTTAAKFIPLSDTL